MLVLRKKELKKGRNHECTTILEVQVNFVTHVSKRTWNSLNVLKPYLITAKYILLQNLHQADVFSWEKIVFN